MNRAAGWLVETLRQPQTARRLAGADWSELFALARAANLLGRLGARLEAAGCPVPPEARRHLAGIAQLSARQHESVLWEAHQLARILAPLGMPVLLLKGAAYVLADLPASRGRLFGDIDILVPKARLGEVEIALMKHGWTSAKRDAYDQRYYRQWMHELPPMQHVRRGTVLDIHHTLLPPTARHHPDPQRLFAAARPLPGLVPLAVPAPTDLVIHSMAHLFHEGELPNGLRDLFDIDALLRHFAAVEPDFANRLVERAGVLDLAYPLFLGLHFVTRLLGTPFPADALEAARRAAAPNAAGLRLLEALYARALQPIHPACERGLTPLARWLLYVRAHWLRMPPHLLAAHLARKAWKGAFPDRTPPLEQ